MPVRSVASIDGSLVSEVPMELEAIVSVRFATQSRNKINGVAVRCRGRFGVFLSDPDGIIPNARAVVRSFASLGARA